MSHLAVHQHPHPSDHEAGDPEAGDHGHGEGHGHDHHANDHDTSLWSKASHWLYELVGGHSHDTADQIDDALEADSAGRRALVISLVGLAVTALIQRVVVLLSGSVALLGDTLHNVADALTAVPLLIAFTLVRRPPNKRYTYGYGRAEDLGGLLLAVIHSADIGFVGVADVLGMGRPRPVVSGGAVVVVVTVLSAL